MDSNKENSTTYTRGVNRGLPILELGDKPLSYFEFWPSWLFYIPVGIYWVLLSIRYRSLGLPMASNPNILLGGMIGESKSAILDVAGPVAKSYVLPYITDRKREGDVAQQAQAALGRANAQGIQFPFVAKPDKGCRGAGVHLIHDVGEFCEYLEMFPVGKCFIIQQLAPYDAEAGVFYVKHPDDKKGRITSLTLKYRPSVIGDGRSSVKELIDMHSRASALTHIYYPLMEGKLFTIPKVGEEVALAFAGSHCRGSIFRNGKQYITPILEAKIEEILADLPDFHFGRLDVKFKDISKLERGKDFVIIEINGASSEATHIWDSRETLLGAFATLFWQYRTLFQIGSKMRSKGVRVPSAWTLILTWIREMKGT